MGKGGAAKTEKELLSRFGQSGGSVKDLCTIRLDLDPLCGLIGKLMVEITSQTDVLNSVVTRVDKLADDVDELKKQETVADVKKELNRRIDAVSEDVKKVREEKADTAFVDSEVARMEKNIRQTDKARWEIYNIRIGAGGVVRDSPADPAEMDEDDDAVNPGVLWILLEYGY